MSPPLYTEVGTCWFTSVCSVCLSRSVCPAVSIVQVEAAKVTPANTRRWPNAGLMLALRLQYWAQYWVTVSCLAPRWMWASVTHGGPTLTQLWFKASCRFRQHEVLTRAEWILASTGDVGPTFNRHWVGVSLNSPPAVSTTRPIAMLLNAAQQTRGVETVLSCDAGPALDQLWVNILCLLGVLTSHNVSRTSGGSKTE